MTPLYQSISLSFEDCQKNFKLFLFFFFFAQYRSSSLPIIIRRAYEGFVTQGVLYYSSFIMRYTRCYHRCYYACMSMYALARSRERDDILVHSPLTIREGEIERHVCFKRLCPNNADLFRGCYR